VLACQDAPVCTGGGRWGQGVVALLSQGQKGEEGGLRRVVGIGSRWRAKATKACALLAWLALLGVPAAFAQASTRLLLASGAGVPGHAGFTFGPFSDLSMNGNRDIIFLSSLRSPRNELRAVVRSSGVSFTVVAFQGLVAPVPRASYDAFSAPSMNDAGVIAFTAALTSERDDVPKTVVVRQEDSKARALATNLDAPPGLPEAKFEEFSAPLVTSDGNVLFGARWSGKGAGSGLFLWSPRGLQALQLPEGMRLSAKDLLEPFFFSHDEAAFVRHGASPDAALEQFFRAIAVQTFQELKPPPDLAEITEVLPGREGVASVQILLVFLENGSLQTALMAGDPSKPVLAVQSPGALPEKPVGRILSLTIGPRGDMVFAAAPADAPNDLGLYCYCNGQLDRLTTAEDFQAVTQPAPGKPLLSLTGDTQQTAAFIASTSGGDSTAIYVTSIP
jgi:hypothetical protein